MKSIKLKKILSFLIDYHLSCSILLICEFILKKTQLYSTNLLISAIIFFPFFILFFITFGLKDLLFQNQSIGKRIFGLAVYTDSDMIPIKSIMIKRSLTTLCFVSIDFILILIKKKCVADYIYKTKVIEVRK